jgi:hypothetical protein
MSIGRRRPMPWPSAEAVCYEPSVICWMPSDSSVFYVYSASSDWHIRLSNVKCDGGEALNVSPQWVLSWLDRLAVQLPKHVAYHFWTLQTNSQGLGATFCIPCLITCEFRSVGCQDSFWKLGHISYYIY